MKSTRALRALIATPVVALAFVSGQAVAAPAHAPAPTAAKVLTYDASGAEEFQSAVDQGATVWNDNVANVELKPVESGQEANVTVVADDGWPRTQTTSLGNGTIWMGREAVNEGHNTVRIASHELGHILGLPDKKPGPCSSLMSGASAGTSCTNAVPDASEKAEVEDAFAGSLGAVHASAVRPLVFKD